MCFQEPTRDRGGVGISHSAYEMRKRERAWTAIQKGSGLVVDERMDLSKGANNDVTVTNLRRRGEKLTRIVNIHDQEDMQSGGRLAQRLSLQGVIRQGGMVLAGDFNTHSSRWDQGAKCSRTPPSGKR